mmetsp:Transcript_19281/g.38168  ORF Transcript_19281/g.38168 Transcript_19281/m.38168 type:complete len:377 (+) Transcript_19281:494-1624(+)
MKILSEDFLDNQKELARQLETERLAEQHQKKLEEASRKEESEREQKNRDRKRLRNQERAIREQKLKQLVEAERQALKAKTERLRSILRKMKLSDLERAKQDKREKMEQEEAERVAWQEIMAEEKETQRKEAHAADEARRKKVYEAACRHEDSFRDETRLAIQGKDERSHKHALYLESLRQKQRDRNAEHNARIERVLAQERQLWQETKNTFLQTIMRKQESCRKVLNRQRGVFDKGDAPMDMGNLRVCLSTPINRRDKMMGWREPDSPIAVSRSPKPAPTPNNTMSPAHAKAADGSIAGRQLKRTSSFYNLMNNIKADVKGGGPHARRQSLQEPEYSERGHSSLSSFAHAPLDHPWIAGAKTSPKAYATSVPFPVF